MKKVYVDTPMFSGWGTIDYEDPKEFYGIQVILDEPDQEGHRLKRVAKYEIVTPPMTNRDVLDFENKDTRFKAISIIDGYNLRTNKAFIVGPTTRNMGTHCFYYDIQTKNCLGCTLIANFKDFTPYEETQQEEAEILELLTPDVIEETLDFVTSQNGQLSFDF